MSDDVDSSSFLTSIVRGLDTKEAEIDDILAVIKRTPISYLDLVTETVGFLKTLALSETPSDPDEIHDLNKEEVIAATYRVNFFAKIRIPALDDEQLEHLLMRAHEIWGEHPTEPMGRWVDWCLWTHLNRRRNGVPITEVIAGNKTATDLKEAWVKRHQAREDRRRLQKVDNFDRYETPEDVPKSIQQIVMSPFISESEMEEIDIELRDVTEENTGPEVEDR